MSLPSKYAPEGLSHEDQGRTITVGQKREPRPVKYYVRTIENRVNEALKSSEANQINDIEMVPMDGFDEVDIISHFVTESRHRQSYDDNDLEIDESQSDKFERSGNVSYLVIDTNFILSHLKILNDLKSIGEEYGLVLIIPITVVKELDGLKSENNIGLVSKDGLSTKSVGHLARWANEWIYSSLANNSNVVKGQRLDQRLDKTVTQDDAILDCCLYFKKSYPNTLQVLLSNDKNFCLKALSNELLTVSYRTDMNAELIATTIYQENIARFGKLSLETSSLKPVKRNNDLSVAAPEEVIHTVYTEIKTITLSAIHHCMESAYGDDLDLLKNYDKDTVTTLLDCSYVMIRFWLPVFSLYFRGESLPFEEVNGPRGEKNPIWVDPPTSGQLSDFINFWSKVLTILYKNEMNEDQNESLRLLINRWKAVTGD